MKNLLASIARNDALSDLRLNNAVSSVVGPLANEKNKPGAMKWAYQQERIING
jgi:hypothetical protein